MSGGGGGGGGNPLSIVQVEHKPNGGRGMYI